MNNINNLNQHNIINMNITNSDNNNLLAYATNMPTDNMNVQN